jgi:hypothetical protein
MKKLNKVAANYVKAFSDDVKPKETDANELYELKKKNDKKRSKSMKMEDEEGLEIEIEKE